MKIIADSGSTKTDWCLIDGNNRSRINTKGINPYYQTSEEILISLHKGFGSQVVNAGELHFYGAGCANVEKNKIVEIALSKFFNTNNISISSDLLGAAKSLCQKDEGIACILGTGSNSGHYKGGKIIKNVSPLGYRLGDEGSGAVIGEKLVSDILKNQLSASTTEMFFDKYKVTANEIIENVYQKQFPNRYLAQFTKFIGDNIHIKELEDIVLYCLNDFVKRNLLQYYNLINLKIHFTGSIAFFFQKQLISTLKSHNLTIGNITQTPIEGLIKYHGF